MNSSPLIAMNKNARKASLLLKQLSNAKRLLILCHLVEGEKSVGDLCKIVGLSSSAVSQHLAKMRNVGLISYDKRGQNVYYHLSSIEAQAVLSTLYLIYCRP